MFGIVFFRKPLLLPRKLLERKRLSKVVSLEEIDSQIPEKIEYLLRFDMFGGNGRTDLFRMGYDTPDRRDSAAPCLFIIESLDDRLVYLDVMGIDEHDLFEITLVFSIIVYGNLISKGFELLHFFQILRFIERNRLKYLKMYAIHIYAGTHPQRSEYHHDTIIVPILFMDIDGNIHVRILIHIGNYLVEHRHSEVRKPSLAGCYIHEIIRTDHFLFPIFPRILDSCQCFEFSDMGVFRIMDILVIRDEFRGDILGIERRDEDIGTTTHLLGHFFIPFLKDVQVLLPYVFCFSKRYVCVFDMFLFRSDDNPCMKPHIASIFYMKIGQKSIYKILNSMFGILLQHIRHISKLALFIYKTESRFIVPVNRGASIHFQIYRHPFHDLDPIILSALCRDYVIITGNIDEDNGTLHSKYIPAELVLIRQFRLTIIKRQSLKFYLGFLKKGIFIVYRYEISEAFPYQFMLLRKYLRENLLRNGRIGEGDEGSSGQMDMFPLESTLSGNKSTSLFSYPGNVFMDFAYDVALILFAFLAIPHYLDGTEVIEDGFRNLFSEQIVDLIM